MVTTNTLTLHQLFDQYFNDYVQNRCKSKEEIRKNFTKYFVPLKDMSVDDIRPVDLQRWHNELGSKHGHATANRSLQLFKAVYNYGDKFELIFFRRNPARSIQRFREEARTRVLTEEETPRLLAAIEQIGSGNRDLFTLALLTSQRIANCCAMEWSELDLIQGTWTIPSRKFKSARKTEIALPDQALEVLNKRRLVYGDSNWVFPSKTSRCGHIIWPYASWRKILKLAKVEDLTPHDLRRTNATKQAELGANMAVIGSNLGHSSLQSTEIYTHPQIATKRQFMQAAANALMGKNSRATSAETEQAALKALLLKHMSQENVQSPPESVPEDIVTVEVSHPIPASSQQLPSQDISLGTFAALYLDRSKRIDKARTTQIKVRLLETYILPILGDRRLRQINRAEIEEFRKRVNDHSPNAAIQCTGLLRHMFKNAVLMGFASFNPFQIEDQRISEVCSILEQVKLIKDPCMSAAVQLAFHLGVGMRGTAVTSLGWRDVDLEMKRVRVENTRSGRYCYKTFSVEICSMLQALPSFGKCELVFPSRRGPGSVTQLYKAWKRACINAGITDRLLFSMKSANQIYFAK
jgi:integrase